jgi:hypothetical protein
MIRGWRAAFAVAGLGTTLRKLFAVRPGVPADEGGQCKPYPPARIDRPQHHIQPNMLVSEAREGMGYLLHVVRRYWGLGVNDLPIVRSGASFEFCETWINRK